MKRDVFISYSRKNLNQVMEVKNQIDSTCGTDCWIDLKGIESGSEMFLRDIVGGIDGCKVFLFMLSKESMESEYALLELNYAKEQGKKIVLVNIDDCRMNGVFLFKYSLTDTIAWNNPPQREKLLRDVPKWVGGSQAISPNLETNDQLKEIEERIAQLDKEIGKLEIYKDSIGKCGFKDKSGCIVIPCHWIDVSPFSEGLASVKDIHGKWGYIDKSGRIVSPCLWKDGDFFREGLIGVKDTNDKWGYINKYGYVVISCQWETARSFHEGLAAVKEVNGKWGYIDKSGCIVIPCKWEYADGFVNGIAQVKDDNAKWWNIDQNGKILGAL